MQTLEFKRLIDDWSGTHEEQLWYEDEGDYLNIESTYGTLACIDKRQYRQFTTTYDARDDLDKETSDFVFTLILEYVETSVSNRIALINAARDKDKITINLELVNDNPTMSTETINWLMEDIRQVLTDKNSGVISEEYY